MTINYKRVLIKLARGYMKRQRAKAALAMDYNENHDPANGRFTFSSGNGIIQSMETKKGTVGTGKGAVEVALGFGSGETEFYSMTSTRSHDEHHARHAASMGLTLKAWKQRAADILNAKADDKNFLDWYNEKIGKYYRYEIKSQCLAIGDADGSITTFFKLEKSKRQWYMPKEYIDILDRKR